MAGFLGADTEALRALGRAVGGGAERLEQLTAQLDGIVGGARWQGPDADAFRADWAGHVRTGMHARVGALRGEAAELAGQADEQDGASGDGGAGGPGGAADGPRASPPPGDVEGIRLMAAHAPLGAADTSAAVGESTLAFPETGLELAPPETAHRIEVDADHALAPDGADEPFGLDEDGAPITLDPDTRYDVGEHGTYYTDDEGRIEYVEAAGGGEAMNPNLRETLPDVTYHVNEQAYYRTDELGRTEHLYVPDVVVDREMARSQSIQSTIAERWDMSGDGTSEPVEFNAGHVLARQLGGIREEINYTRQWDEVNQARSGQDTIYTYESLMADGISDEDSSYAYETRIEWGEEQPAGVGPQHDSAPWEYVSSGYDVRIHEDGEQIVEDHLPNYPEGATFPR
ncbi:DNA/RNA non-specific endonuclease [Brachybacterium paraconglomeratum]|uniref:DNA/RNA non-specific endonuclease n=1 Tax=Brachybacterium paraconglomeratum TaxID=173362 RepID=UPI0021A6C40E|nr:DNA/RNA non-specific endonuclease [Brachybacterium paraconglomeratum]MCT1908087.1 DNA/RNA non-specific endonuclease [Brachybacterium paraconglomeratum]